MRHRDFSRYIIAIVIFSAFFKYKTNLGNTDTR